jgi:hypothetical protein
VYLLGMQHVHYREQGADRDVGERFLARFAGGSLLQGLPFSMKPAGTVQ